MAISPGDNDPIVPNPTWMGYVRGIFTDAEKTCMKSVANIDLATYDGVRTHATDIYLQTSSGNMPYGGPPWSANRVKNFLTWVLNKFPMGTAQPQATALLAAAPTPNVRLRKNVDSLQPDEVALLAKAFTGVMARDPANPNSYYQLAGIHGLPYAFCMHHVQAYNPWHRYYVTLFENALRTVEGCESVTLPYWDITSITVPKLLSQAPFNAYTVPSGAPDFPPDFYTLPYTTQRSSDADIEQELQKFKVTAKIQTALSATRFGSYDANPSPGFQQPIIYAHDDGHNSVGPTMQDQNVAAFDPIFWFFHCNWERLFLSWQTLVGGTTLPSFKSTLDGDLVWLDLPLDPWRATSADVVAEPDIAYDQLATGVEALQDKRGSVEAIRSFTIAPSSRVSVRVKDINRMNIPGSFIVKLLADGEEVARQSFFQPRTPKTCATCSQVPLVPIDFQVDLSQVQGRKLSVAIEVPQLKELGTTFPLKQAGNPTINARLLLEEA